MYIKMKKIFILVFLLTANIFLSSNKIERYIDPDMIRQAAPPIFTDKGVIITLPPEIGYQVFIRTDLDGWKNNHYFKRSFFGIYYCFLEYDFDRTSIRYRININGFWDTNPMGGEIRTDYHGNAFSILRYPEELHFIRKTPIVKNISGPGNLAVFRIYAPEASQVNLVFSGSNFSTFANPMRNRGNGYWEIELKVDRGVYSYYFLVDGRKHIDSDNNDLIYDPIMGSLSKLTVK